MTICYFTATGNCLYIAESLGGTCLSIPKLMRQAQIEIADDAVGIVCPVYAGEMPKMVRAFLAKANIKTDYFFFIYTYGMAYGEAFAHAALAARAAGLALAYVGAVRMVDNYLPIFKMQQQIEHLPEKKVEQHLFAIRRDIESRKTTAVRITPAVKLKMAVYQAAAKRILNGDTAQSYLVNASCTLCGVCARVCPADNIRLTDKVNFSSRCEVCYACLHNCPQNAIHLKREASPARFRNANVSLKQIVAANDDTDKA
ncbi:MAG: EFR1 family ferrodoxin [Clostridia bacterium]|nr:EFR1 family ferrodoxin [Clostridia bacterium]